jgi:hypothetical protein
MKLNTDKRFCFYTHSNININIKLLRALEHSAFKLSASTKSSGKMDAAHTLEEKTNILGKSWPAGEPQISSNTGTVLHSGEQMKGAERKLTNETAADG